MDIFLILSGDHFYKSPRTRPRRIARVAAEVRSETPSLSKMFLM
ncbi:MAG: hypothetical protein WKF90_09975 [Pyrinomonadaceae bacterium]